MVVHIRAGGPGFREAARLMNGRMMKRAQVKAVNVAGKALRQKLMMELPKVIPTARKSFGIKARAAYRGQDDPNYRVAFNRAVEIGKIRAAAKRFELRSRGRGFAVGRFSVRTAGGKLVTFQAVSREGAGQKARLRLLKAGDLPERGLSGVVISSDFRKYDGLRGLEDQAIEDAADAIEAEIKAAWARARTSAASGGGFDMKDLGALARRIT